MYQSLLSKLIHCARSRLFWDNVERMIYPYKPEMPVLIINLDGNFRIFEISRKVFEIPSGGFDGPGIEYWLNILKKKKLALNTISCNKPVQDCRCYYCFGWDYNCCNNIKGIKFCESCIPKIRSLSLTQSFGILESNIIFKYTAIISGPQLLDELLYIIDGHSLKLWYKYPNYYQQLTLTYFSEVTEYPPLIKLFNPVNFDNHFNKSYACKSIKCYTCNCNIRFIADDELHLCDVCRLIIKERMCLQNVFIVIVTLHHLDAINDDIKRYILKFLVV